MSNLRDYTYLTEPMDEQDLADVFTDTLNEYIFWSLQPFDEMSADKLSEAEDKLREAIKRIVTYNQ